MALRPVPLAMKMRKSTSREWVGWVEVQKVAVRVWFDGDLPAAIEVVNRFLAENPPLDLQRQALGFRGSLEQERGDLQAARSDFLAARGLSEHADFERCTLEEAAAAASLQLGDLPQAERLYLEALKTAASDPRTSGGGVVLSLLKLRGESGLSEEERTLAEKVIRQSWHLLRVEGEPDLIDLASTAQRVIEAQAGPFSAEKPPTPKAF